MAECAGGVRAASGVPVVVVNARISDRSLPRYLRLRRWWRPFLQMLTLVLAQSEEDARSFVAIGVPEERVRRGRQPEVRCAAAAIGARWWSSCGRGLPSGARVLVAGSTLEDEERVLLEAWPAICAQVPNAVLVLAPRHPERLHASRRWRAKRSCSLVQRSVMGRRSGGCGQRVSAGLDWRVEQRVWAGDGGVCGWQPGAGGRAQSAGTGAVGSAGGDGAAL